MLIKVTGTVQEVRDNSLHKEFPSDTTTIEIAESGVKEKSVIRVKVPGSLPDLFTGDAVTLEADVVGKVFQGRQSLVSRTHTITRNGNLPREGGKNK